MQRNSLKFILLLAGAGILIALTCLISGLAYYIGQKKITETYIAQMHGTVGVVGQEIDDFFTTHVNVIRMAAKDPRTIASVKTSSPIAKEYYKELKDLYGVYDNVYAHTYGQDPTVIADADGNAIGYKLKNEEMDPEELKAGKEKRYFIGKPILNPLTNKPIVTITFPVYDGERLIGNSGIALSLTDLTEKVIQKIKIGQAGYVVVTTKAGLLIATKDKELILKYDLAKDEAGAKMLALKTGEDLEFNYQNEDHIATTYHLDKWGMMIIAVQPKGEINYIILELLLFIGLSALAIAVLSVGLLYILLNKRLNPLEKASLIFRSMATGDLTSDIEIVYQDEIGQMGRDMNSFIESLRRSLKDIQRIAFELASASEELTSSSQNFAMGAQSTAASSEQMSATVEEMSAGMENIAFATERQYGNIMEFHSKIKELSESVRRIGVQIESTLNLTKSISNQARKGEESIQGMSKMIENILHSSGEMTAIISIINEISDQTQLLALNAAIEAARAGEAGRGFAVVADEISKLAEKTASSINSIGSMITNNNRELDSGANAIRSSAEIIHGIMQNIDSVAEAMNQLYSITETQESLKREVDQGAEKMGSDAEAVKLSTDEQKRAVREIAAVITQINEHTLNTASGSEEMSSSAQNLATTAETLRSITEKFKV
ncbi:methyl-accepting chemotaxis protein [Leptospira wolffii]|uniref:methyl-accepting chemotaxis protein n=1 Tax=Leptospira wolffii TaxID=409998 RepID=UPI00108329BF|nr:methyl-accepting chemotaxis protein [Leptospira wolffii]TGK62716.1 methyl-accepting chemotaxis protein [Leptospira wolffii]TGK73897.1 methyl-accepting chemotaxis protein [Leptospira wolffii]TGK75052.1 methyl-accepting chemotaxis protein [Leptospira wolffii]TGL28759.1 methyl-accepting chemotaxis protein [Leptospira wolffii]